MGGTGLPSPGKTLPMPLHADGDARLRMAHSTGKTIAPSGNQPEECHGTGTRRRAWNDTLARFLFPVVTKQERPMPGRYPLKGARDPVWPRLVRLVLARQHGAELDILLQKRRDKAAAKRFFKRVRAACPEVPSKIVTDQLRSYPAAKAEIPALANVLHVFVKASARVNNRAENSHQPTRDRERSMRGFRLPERTQAFLSSSPALCAQAPSVAPISQAAG